MSRARRAGSPSARYTALLRTTPSSRILTRSASKNTTGYSGSSGRACHAVTSATTASVTALIRSGRHLDRVDLLQIPLNLARRQPARVQRQDLVIEAGQAARMLRRPAPARTSRRDRAARRATRAVVGQHRLRTRAIAVIGRRRRRLAPPRRIAEVMAQLAAEHPLDQRAFQPPRGGLDLGHRHAAGRTKLIQESRQRPAPASQPVSSGCGAYRLLILSPTHKIPDSPLRPGGRADAVPQKHDISEHAASMRRRSLSARRVADVNRSSHAQPAATRAQPRLRLLAVVPT